MTNERDDADSLEGLVLCADVEADGSAFDGERIERVVLDHHLGVLGAPQLDEGLVKTDGGVSVAGKTLWLRLTILPPFLPDCHFGSSSRVRHLVRQKEMFLHDAEASGDRQQLLLLVFFPGQVGEEDHLAAAAPRAVPGRSVRRPLFLLPGHKRRRVKTFKSRLACRVAAAAATSPG